MIDLKHYERILDSGLMFDHYLVLCMVKNGEELPKNRRVQGFINLLNKKGYIQDGVLTDEATVLTECDIKTVSTTVEKEEVQTDFTIWVIGLHKKCQSKLLELTGGKQVRGKIGGKPYPFLPNSTDLAKSLHRAIVLYKLTDLEKIEKAMIGHILKCHKANNWFPLMKYYIIKSGAGGSVASANSDMVTDMETIDEVEEVKGKSNQKFV